MVCCLLLYYNALLYYCFYYFLKNFPEFLEITREPAVTTMEGTVVEETFYTLNQLASGMNQGYFHVDGFKTGSSPNAALNHVITAKEKGRRVIEVLMGVGSWSDYNTSVYYRAQFGNAILEKAFTEYREETVLKAGVHEIDGQKIKVEKDIKAITSIYTIYNRGNIFIPTNSRRIYYHC